MIVVFGDLILDKFSYGTINRLNPEAPVPLLNIIKEEYFLGGAANVAKNLFSLTKNIIFMSPLSRDKNNAIIKDLIKKINLPTFLLPDDRSSIIKQRFISIDYNQQLLRVDYEKIVPINNELADFFLEKIKLINPDYIILSDYNKGAITEYFVKKLKKEFKGKIIVDPKPKNINFYKNLFLIKPNIKEASSILGREIPNENKAVEKAGLELVNKLNSNIVITRGKKGASLITIDKKIIHIPVKIIESYDISGAGDTFIATLTFGLKKGLNLKEAINLANKASSIVIKKLGVVSITKEELFKRD